jgi:hypothetical protein
MLKKYFLMLSLARGPCVVAQWPSASASGKEEPGFESPSGCVENANASTLTTVFLGRIFQTRFILISIFASQKCVFLKLPRFFKNLRG